MQQKKANILVVCMANYCRSPVAEYLMKRRIKEHNISSAGIIHFDKSGMDARSLKFLEKFNEVVPFHQPRKISTKLINESDLVFALDFNILRSLNNKYRDKANKFRLFTIRDEKIVLNDPYRLELNEYYKIMEKIEYVSSKILIKI